MKTHSQNNQWPVRVCLRAVHYSFNYSEDRYAEDYMLWNVHGYLHTNRMVLWHLEVYLAENNKNIYEKITHSSTCFTHINFFQFFFLYHFTYFVNVCVQQYPLSLVPGFALCTNCLFVEQLLRQCCASSCRFPTHFLLCLHRHVE